MKTKMLIVGIVLAALLVTVSSVSAEAEIWTDKNDYPPDSIVNISGSGFSAGSSVTIAITDPNSGIFDCQSDRSCPTVAGDTFNYDYKLNGLTGEYGVVADDGNGNTATTTFTDSLVFNVYSKDSDCSTHKENFVVGDTVCAKGIAITKWPMKIEIIDSMGTVVASNAQNFKSSSITKQYTIKKCEDPSGQWTIKLYRWVYRGSYWKHKETDHFNVAEPSIETILDCEYDPGCWNGPIGAQTFFATGTAYTAKAIVVDSQCGYKNPTGWYDAGSPASKHPLWADPEPGDPPQDIQTTGSFGLYIEPNGDAQSTYYTETSLNPTENGAKRLHAKVYEITCGNADYVVAFEDKSPDDVPPWDQDYNDVVIELRGASEVPEFATIAIPAIAVLGLFLFFNKRKHKKE